MFRKAFCCVGLLSLLAAVPASAQVTVQRLQVQPSRVVPGGTAIVLVDYKVPGATADSPVRVTEIRRILSSDGAVLASSEVEKQIVNEKVQSILPIWIPPTAQPGEARVEAVIQTEDEDAEIQAETALSILGPNGSVVTSTEGESTEEENAPEAVDPRLIELEEKAEAAFGNYQYVTPAGDNVLEYAQAMLEIDPLDSYALGRKKDLGDHFIQLADKAAQENRQEEVVHNLELFLQVFPEDTYVISRLDDARKKQEAASAEMAEAEREALQKKQEAEAWSEAEQVATIEAYQRFVDAFPRSDKTSTAFQRIQQLQKERSEANLEMVQKEKDALLAARDADTVSGWQQFLADYPSSPSASYAQGRLEQLQAEDHSFEQARRLNTSEAYETFLQRYPSSSHAAEARVRMTEIKAQAQQAEVARLEGEKAAFLKANTERIIEGYEAFLAEYPRSDYASLVVTLLEEARKAESASAEEDSWAAAQTANTVEGYQAFINEFPNSGHLETAMTKIASIQAEAALAADNADYDRARKADNIKAYEAYLQAHPDGQNTRAAERRIDELEKLLEQKRLNEKLKADWAKAEKADSIETYQAFLKAYPDSRYASQAQARIDRIRVQQETARKNSLYEEAMNTQDLAKLESWAVSYPKDPRIRKVQTLIAAIQEARARDQYGPTVEIKAGEFVYGAPGKEQVIYLPEFWIDKYEVTNKEYKKFLDANPDIAPPKHWDGKNYPRELANHPAVWVSHPNALAYCRWAGKRLPTQEEWQKSCRGPNFLTYPWGDEWRDGLANTKEAGHKGTTPVDFYEKAGNVSPWGVVDCAGNVWEWTSQMKNDKEAWMKGGSFEEKKDYTRNERRHDHKITDDGDHDHGFRCIWEPKRR